MKMIDEYNTEVQTSWACSAQSPEMLPKRKTVSNFKDKVKTLHEGYF